MAVAIKVSVEQIRSDQKILRKMGIFENEAFPQKWKCVKQYEIVFVYWNCVLSYFFEHKFIENNNLWQTKSCSDAFICDNRQKDKVRKKDFP